MGLTSTLPVLVFITAAFAAAVPVQKQQQETMSASEFGAAVLRQLGLPQSVASELESNLYRLANLVPNAMSDLLSFRDIPQNVANLSPAEQTTLAEFMQGAQFRELLKDAKDARAAIKGLQGLSFAQQHVDFVVNFLSSYSAQAKSPFDIQDAVQKFKLALNNANGESGVVRTRQLSVSALTGDMTSVMSAVAGDVTGVLSGGSIAGAAPAAATTAPLAEATGFFGTLWSKTQSFLTMYNNLPLPIKMILAKALPPVNMIIHGLEFISCVADNKAGFTFSDNAALADLLKCNIELVVMLPVGEETRIGIKLLINLVSMGLDWSAGTPPTSAAFMKVFSSAVAG